MHLLGDVEVIVRRPVRAIEGCMIVRWRRLFICLSGEHTLPVVTVGPILTSVTIIPVPVPVPVILGVTVPIAITSTVSGYFDEW